MPPSIYESAMAEMVHNFKQLGEMMGPFLDRHPGLRGVRGNPKRRLRGHRRNG
jgi:hypothetical protein